MGRKMIDISGEIFNDIKVLRRTSEYGARYPKWLCICHCGKEFEAFGNNIRSGNTKSCGCSIDEKPNRKTHGASRPGHPDNNLYKRWIGMKVRCYNENSVSYKNYGGRGIKVCKEWKNSFENFKKWSHENGFSEELSIDRINTNEDYRPKNCRWVKTDVQANNKRSSVNITFDGITKTLTEWCYDYGFDKNLARLRYQRGIRGKEIFAASKIDFWTKNEDEYLRENFNHKSTRELAEELDRTFRGVQRRRALLGLKMR